MAAQTFLLMVDDLQFPDFGDDDSKKNFRLLITILGNDADGEPITLLAALPPVSEDNWTWKPGKKKAQNFVPNDGRGHIFIEQLTPAARLVLHERVEILSVDATVLDTGDKNALSHLIEILNDISKAGIGLLTGGAGGLFAKLIKSAEGSVQNKAKELMEVWAKISTADKRLFRKDFTRVDFGPLSPGTFKIEGCGVLKHSNDNKGAYSISFSLIKAG